MGVQLFGGEPTDAIKKHGPSPEAVEGRILAHRQILVLLIAEMQHRGGAAEMMAALDSLSVMQDHQEDPGAVPDAAMAIVGAFAEEIGLIHRACAALAGLV